MDVLEENMQVNNSLIINNEVKDYVLQIAKWAKFLSIIGFVGLGLMLIGGLSVITIGNTVSTFNRTPSPVPFALLGLIYLVLSVFYFFPVYYLYKSSVGLKKGISSNSQDSFTDGFKNLKAHYKFIGITMIVVLSIYALIFVFGMLAMMFK